MTTDANVSAVLAVASLSSIRPSQLTRQLQISADSLFSPISRNFGSYSVAHTEQWLINWALIKSSGRYLCAVFVSVTMTVIP